MSETYTSSNLRKSLQWLKGERFYIFLAIYFVCLLLPAYWLDVFETTDSRYSEISREMLQFHNYLEPFYNGIKHFHKPPFTYWITALGLDLFGVNGLGARFFGAVFAVLTLIFTKKTAMLLTSDEDKADASVLVLASSFLFLVVARVVSTDIFLTFFAIGGLYYLFNQIYGVKSMKNALMFAVMLGFGFLTKGPVIFLFTLLPFVVAKFFNKEHRHVFSIKEGAYAILLFVAIALPWYLYVISVTPGLLHYFLYDQTVERVTDASRFHRAEPFYFFPMIFLSSFFPWIYYFFKNLKYTDVVKPGRAIYLYVLMPFIVFQISSSKLATYLLPFYPVCAIIVAGKMDSEFLPRVLRIVFTALGLVVAVAPFFVPFLKPFAIYIAAAAVIYTIIAYSIAFKNYSKTGYLASVSFLIILFGLLAYGVITFSGPNTKGYRLSAADIKKFDPQGKYPVLVYHAFAPSISFYLNDVKMLAFATKRETLFQTKAEYGKYYIDTNEDLQNYLDTHDKFIVFTFKNYASDIISKANRQCTQISERGGKKLAFFCEKK